MDGRYSSKLVAERLDEVLTDYMAKHGIERRRHLCEAWGINESHMSNVINGYMEISVTIIAQAVLKHGNVNLNYLMGGRWASMYMLSRF